MAYYEPMTSGEYWRKVTSLSPIEKIGGGGGGSSAGGMSAGYMNAGSSTPSYSLPQMPDLPEYVPPEDYVAPEYDESKVRALTQEQAAPAIRGLRSAMQRIQSGNYENPNVARMTLREALAGYGQGLQSAMSGAAGAAREAYGREYATKTDEAKTRYGSELEAKKLNYQTEVNAALTAYQAALAAYMAKMYGTGSTKYGAVSSMYSDDGSGISGQTPGIPSWSTTSPTYSSPNNWSAGYLSGK